MVARAIRLIGALSLVMAVALSGFLAYEYWWTNNSASQIQDIQREQFLHNVVTETTSPFGESLTTQVRKGDVFALMYIPRLREEVWGMPILEGVDDQQLANGIGHYPLTAKPGEKGNFATFGHRTTHGQPYSSIQLLETGDEIYVRTNEKWFVYELIVDTIVLPTDVWVMRSRALENSRVKHDTNGKLITLITCTPRHSTKQRWVWWGHLSEVRELEDSPL